MVEQIQRKSRIHERTPQNAPRIRAGETLEGPKGGIKHEPNPQAPSSQTSFPPLIPLITRQARDAKSPKWKRSDGGQQRNRIRLADRGGDLDARGEVTRDRKHRKSPPSDASSHHQRPRCANNKTTTTARHPELRDPLPNLSDDRSRGIACSLFEWH